MSNLIGEKVKVTRDRRTEDAIFLGWGLGFKNNNRNDGIAHFTVAMIQINGTCNTCLPSELKFNLDPPADTHQSGWTSTAPADGERYIVEGSPVEYDPINNLTPEDVAFMLGWKGDRQAFIAINWPLDMTVANLHYERGMSARTTCEDEAIYAPHCP